MNLQVTSKYREIKSSKRGETWSEFSTVTRRAEEQFSTSSMCSNIHVRTELLSDHAKTESSEDSDESDHDTVPIQDGSPAVWKQQTYLKIFGVFWIILDTGM